MYLASLTPSVWVIWTFCNPILFVSLKCINALIQIFLNSELASTNIVVVVVQSLTRVRLFVAPWTAAHQASLSFIIFWSLLKLMSIESVMPSNHLILCHPLFLLPSIFPSIRVFSNELVICIRWPKYWSFSFSISPSANIQGWFPLGLTGLIFFLAKELSRVFSGTTIQKHQFFGGQPSLWSNSHIHTWSLEKP